MSNKWNFIPDLLPNNGDLCYCRLYSGYSNVFQATYNSYSQSFIFGTIPFPVWMVAKWQFISSTAPVTPLTIWGANVKAWYSPSSIINTSGLINKWSDISGNNNHLLQANNTSAPIYLPNAINNQAGVMFSGSQYMSLTSGINLTNADTYIYIYKKFSNSSYFSFFCNVVGANYCLALTDQLTTFGYYPTKNLASYQLATNTSNVSLQYICAAVLANGAFTGSSSHLYINSSSLAFTLTGNSTVYGSVINLGVNSGTSMNNGIITEVIHITGHIATLAELNQFWSAYVHPKYPSIL